MSVLAPRGNRSAEEVVKRDYARLRRAVLNGVRSRLRQYGLRYDELDLEGFYNAAWHALHGRLSAGEDISNPEGFLIAVACRRAIDDARRLRGLDLDVSAELDEQGAENDVADELDQRTLLRHFREGLKEKLTERECQAATLCLILGYTRPKAAEMLGISPKRMERIMDDAQQKIGAFVATITDDSWCEHHESLMRAYALRVLDEHGDRYKLAKVHLEECSACRHFVLGLRNISAVIPPVALPLELTDVHAATLAHLNAIVRHAWRHKINLIGPHVASTKSGAAAGAGAGVGVGVGGGAGVGTAVVSSGVGAKAIVLCVAFCLAGGAAIVGAGGKPGPIHRASARTHRKALSAHLSAPLQPESRLSASAPGLHQQTAASRATSQTHRRTRPASSDHRSAPARQVIATRPATTQTSSASAGTPAEFGFEGSGESRSASTPAPTSAPATQATVSRSRPTSHSASSEFGFEGG